MGNEKWMGAHLALLTIDLGSYIWATFFASTYTAYTVYDVIGTIVYFLMAFIMDQVNSPQYTVWANRKFVGKNKEEVSQFILSDRESINEERFDELNASQIVEDSDKPPIRQFEIDDSLFEDP